MKQQRSLIALLAMLAVLVALPAAASAKSASAKTGAPAVRAHVVKAKKALRKFKVAVQTNHQTIAATQLTAARRHTAAASKSARRMAGRAETAKQSLTAAKSLTLAGTQCDALAESITALVDEISGHVQVLIAQAIPSALAAKQKVIEVLTQLLETAPAQAKPIIASIIAALAAGDATEITNLDSALDGGTLPAAISSMVSDSLGMATQALQTAFATVKSILPLLPAAIQAPLTMIVDMVGATVGTLLPSVLGTVTGLVDQILGSLPYVASSATSGLGGLLGAIVGGPSSAGGLDISGLLSGLFADSGSAGDAPAGIGSVISSVTGMISNLLGGLLGR